MTCVAFFQARDAGGSGVGGIFCMADTLSLCPGSESLAVPPLRENTACSNPRLSGQNGSSCIDAHTMRCLRENECVGAYELVSSVLNSVELKHVRASANDGWFFLGLGIFLVYLLSFFFWEFPLSRDAYAWGSTSVPEKIFMQPFLIGVSLILKISVLVLLRVLIVATRQFPSSASCHDVNLLPTIDDVKLYMQSRAEFLTKCEIMASTCRVSIVGIPQSGLNTKTVVSVADHLNLLFSMCALLLIAVFIHKWLSWLRCVAETVDPEGAAAYLRAQEEADAEQFELAIRRIQARRREKREERERRRESTRSRSERLGGVPPPNPYIYAVGVRENDLLEDTHSIVGAEAVSEVNVTRGELFDLNVTTESAAGDTVSTTSEGSQGDGHDCIICLDSLANGEGVESLLCGHVFHSPCINAWFDECDGLQLHGGQGRLCPLCRHPS